MPPAQLLPISPSCLRNAPRAALPAQPCMRELGKIPKQVRASFPLLIPREVPCSPHSIPCTQALCLEPSPSSASVSSAALTCGAFVAGDSSEGTAIP